MATYIDPTGTFTATAGDDSIIFDAAPTVSSTIDAAGGNDSLLVQFDSATPVSFDVSDEFGAGYLNVQITPNPFTYAYIQHVENVDLHGTANDDSFRLMVQPSSSALTVTMDGGDGQDLLRFDWSRLASGLSFVVDGSTITSSFGSFASFEQFFVGGPGDDDTIVTGAGNDVISTGAGVDHVNSGAGADNILIGSNGGTIVAGDGDDHLSLVVGANSPGFAGSIDGGLGSDFLSLDCSALGTGLSFVVKGASITDNIGELAGFEAFSIAASAYGDTITLGAGDDSVLGFDGNDSISAGDGDNVVSGGDGNDIIGAGLGNDLLSGSNGDDAISGGGGSDSLTGDLGNDTIDGGDGFDTIYGDQNVPFSSADDGNDHLAGGAGNDTIYGGGGDDTIDGDADNDSLIGGTGADHIDGGDGNDVIFGYGENGWLLDDGQPDVLIGGAGDDSIQAGWGDSVDGGFGSDMLDLNLITAPTGVDVDLRQLTSGGTVTVGGATLTGIEYVSSVSGTNFNDVIVAGAAQGVQAVGINGLAGDDNLTGSSGVDWIYGGDGNDLLFGGNGNDILTGDLGADVLTGGAGNDIFRDVAAGLDGDTITDFAVGDTILISDATLAGFTFSLTDHTLSFTGASLTLESIPVGRLVARAAAEGGVEISVDDSPAHNDFNGDGRSDILWQDGTGQLTNWLANADGSFTANSTNAYANVSTDWHIIGTGDFNGDGREDLLWRNDSGLLTNWLGTANGGWSTNGAATVNVPTDWSVVGVADFNGDGHADILWRNSTGQLTDWLGTANGSFSNNSANASQFVATNWHVIATGDFNGDGYQDILWRENGGQLTDWLGGSNGGFTQNGSHFSEFVVNEWQVIATGDFNGDGITDLLWRDTTTGQLTDWLGTSTGGFTQNSASFSEHVALNWQVVGIGDFNGDANDDILWRDSNSGQMTNWLGTSTGGFTPNSTHFSEAVSTAWHVVDPFM